MSRLESEQNIRISYRSRETPQSKTPTRSYKEDKEEYLSIISEVGEMETALLNCNLEKKRIQQELDKIDNVKIKTKDIISKRRRLEVELQNEEEKLGHVKIQLKKLKVI